MQNNIEIFHDDDVEMPVNIDKDSVWITQAQLAELYRKDVSTISIHISNIYAENELDREKTSKKVTIEANLDKTKIGLTKPITYYNLDMILSVGYRVRSEVGSRFRLWASEVIKGHLLEHSSISYDKRRVSFRGQIKDSNTKLSKTAQDAGVKNFSKFHGMGIRGLYDLSVDKIREVKKIGKDDFLDRAGATELAANWFRITQTDEVLKNEKIKGEGQASMKHYSIGRKIRKTIESIKGAMPEDLNPEEHIKVVEKRIKKETLKTIKTKKIKNNKLKKIITPLSLF